MLKIILIIAFLATNLFSQGFLNTTVALTGNVFNEVTKFGETVNITLMNGDKKAGATRSIGSQNGSYYIAGLKPGVTYTISLKKKGFMTLTKDITIPNTDKYLELSQDFLVRPMEKGLKIPLAVSPFEINKSKLRVGSDLFLKDLVNSMRENHSVKIKLISYPDEATDKAKNQTLTNERVKAIKDYLVENKIPAERIEFQGNTDIDPLKPLPTKKSAKGKRYIGTTYFELLEF